MNKYLYKKVNTESAKVFTHYWTNNGENYPDIDPDENGNVSIENFLDANFGDAYAWVPANNIRLERTNIGSTKIEVPASELGDNRTFFIKVVDENLAGEIPQYYYSEEITAVSDENFNVTSYQVNFELDYWSTFGCKMHYYMKKDVMNEDFLFLRKMCNRFFYNEDQSAYWMDYLLQPYLMQTGSYDYNLIRDVNEDNLSLAEWREMNGCSEEEWNKWVTANYPISYIECSTEFSPKSISHYSSGSKALIQNEATFNFSSANPLPSLDDSLFNSRGKYRYLVTKFGNNTCWASEDLKLTEDQYKYLITENEERAEFKTEDGKKILSKVEELIRNKDTAKQCINTKKVKGTEMSSGTQSTIYLNGESLCIVPFPKGSYEELYLFYLNSHDKGIVLGNGTMLGMTINDIPPSIYALAIRNYNNKNFEAAKKIEQTIGDKLSFRSNEDGTQTCPASWTSLMLQGNWDWDMNMHTFKYGWSDASTKTINTEWVEIHYWQEQLKEGYVDHYEWRPKTGIPAGYYGCQPTTSATNTVYNWNYDMDGWKMSDIIESAWELTPGGKAAFVLYFDGTDAHKKSAWKVIAKNEAYKEAEATVGSAPVIEESPQIPPIVSTANTWYHWSADPFNVIYQDAVAKHYFPTIFHDFSYVPIAVQEKSEDEIYGAGRFFEKYYELLTIEDEPKPNTKENEPLLYGPAFWRWIYYIDGLNKLVLTADMIDFDKFMSTDWMVNLDMTMTMNTSYRLDIEPIRNNQYPFTKSMTELVSQDPITFPFTSESFNNWYQNNMNTMETSKNAKDITNEWALKSIPYAKAQAWLGGIGGGISAGASTANIWAGLGLAGAGIAAGAIGASFAERGIRASIDEANAQWNNKWQGALGNMYGAPTSLNPSGFSSGALIYSPSAESNDSYNLFKTFTITDIARAEVWDDVSMNGYFFKSQCNYRDYDNRNNFNIVNCNFDDKDSVVNIYLRGNMGTETTIFSQQIYVDWFKAKCKASIRLFHVLFTPESLQQIIESNTEKSYIYTPRK